MRAFSTARCPRFLMVGVKALLLDSDHAECTSCILWRPCAGAVEGYVYVIQCDIMTEHAGWYWNRVRSYVLQAARRPTTDHGEYSRRDQVGVNEYSRWWSARRRGTGRTWKRISCAASTSKVRQWATSLRGGYSNAGWLRWLDGRTYLCSRCSRVYLPRNTVIPSCRQLPMCLVSVTECSQTKPGSVIPMPIPTPTQLLHRRQRLEWIVQIRVQLESGNIGVGGLFRLEGREGNLPE